MANLQRASSKAQKEQHMIFERPLGAEIILVAKMAKETVSTSVSNNQKNKEEAMRTKHMTVTTKSSECKQKRRPPPPANVETN